jgi:hypothetical protein
MVIKTYSKSHNAAQPEQDGAGVRLGAPIAIRLVKRATGGLIARQPVVRR